MRRVDLHVHTTFSDGLHSPTEIISMSKKNNIKALSITDHDTLEGISDATNAGLVQGIEIIPGIEISTDYKGKDIHILGYLFLLDFRPLTKLISIIKKDRVNRMEKMISKLNKLGLNIDISDVVKIAGSGTLGRPHLALAMFQKQYIKNVGDAFEKYIGFGKPAYVERFKVTPANAIHLIRGAGGVPVLAHPGINGKDHLIPSLVKEGLLGLEVFHPRHSWSMYIKYWEYAHQYKLAITGGSDFHGLELGSSPILGGVTISYRYLLKLKKIARRAREMRLKFL